MSTLIDSDVLVWLTRGHVGAAQRLHALNHWRISAVTYMELAQGCRDKAELARLKKGLAPRGTEIVPITPAISECAADPIDPQAAHDSRLAPQRPLQRPAAEQVDARATKALRLFALQKIRCNGNECATQVSRCIEIGLFEVERALTSGQHALFRIDPGLHN